MPRRSARVLVTRYSSAGPERPDSVARESTAAPTDWTGTQALDDGGGEPAPGGRGSRREEEEAPAHPAQVAAARPRRQLLEDSQGAVPRADASQQARELVARLEGVGLDLARVLEQGERVAPAAARAKPARSVDQRIHGVDGPPALHLEVGEREPEAMLLGEVHAGLAVDPDRLLDEALLGELPRDAAVALPGVRGAAGCGPAAARSCDAPADRSGRPRGSRGRGRWHACVGGGGPPSSPGRADGFDRRSACGAAIPWPGLSAGRGPTQDPGRLVSGGSGGWRWGRDSISRSRRLLSGHGRPEILAGEERPCGAGRDPRAAREREALSPAEQVAPTAAIRRGKRRDPPQAHLIPAPEPPDRMIGGDAPPGRDAFLGHHVSKQQVGLFSGVAPRRNDRARRRIASVAIEEVVDQRRGDRELEGRDQPPERARHGGEVEGELARHRDLVGIVEVAVVRLEPPAPGGYVVADDRSGKRGAGRSRPWRATADGRRPSSRAPHR